MSARRVGRATRQRRIAALPAVPEPTEATLSWEYSVVKPTDKESGVTSGPTSKSVVSGSIPISRASVNEFLTSKPSVPPSAPSTRPWKAPSNVKQFAAQTNAVATMVLRGEMDLERARVYSGLARTVAQAMSTEVSRARFLAQEPDLSLEEEDPEA